jgi:glutaredoxin
MPNLVLYTKKDCPRCVMIKRLLDKKQITYETIDVDDRADLTDKLIAMGMMNLPVLQSDDSFCNDYNELIKNYK